MDAGELQGIPLFDGLSKKDIIRCLKRYLARELYQLLPEPSSGLTELPSAA